MILILCLASFLAGCAVGCAAVAMSAAEEFRKLRRLQEREQNEQLNN